MRRQSGPLCILPYTYQKHTHTQTKYCSGWTVLLLLLLSRMLPTQWTCPARYSPSTTRLASTDQVRCHRSTESSPSDAPNRLVILTHPSHTHIHSIFLVDTVAPVHKKTQKHPNTHTHTQTHLSITSAISHRPHWPKLSLSLHCFRSPLYERRLKCCCRHCCRRFLSHCHRRRLYPRHCWHVVLSFCKYFLHSLLEHKHTNTFTQQTHFFYSFSVSCLLSPSKCPLSLFFFSSGQEGRLWRLQPVTSRQSSSLALSHNE